MSYLGAFKLNLSGSNVSGSLKNLSILQKDDKDLSIQNIHSLLPQNWDDFNI